MSQGIDFLNLFVRPPGELLYFFTVIAISLASLFMALSQRLRHPDDPSATRYTLALVGIVLAWILLMLGALLALLTDRQAVSVLPPLERFATLLSVILLGWAFLAEAPQLGRAGRVFLAALLIAVIAGYIVTAVQWVTLAGRVDYNLSLYGTTWSFAAALLSGVGILLMIVYFRVVFDAPLKLVFFLILLFGYGGTLLQIASGSIIGDYAGPIRLAFVAALSIIPALLYRAVIVRFEHALYLAYQGAARSAAQQDLMRIPAADRVGAGLSSAAEREALQLLRALGIILEGADTLNLQEKVVHAAIELFKADVGGLLRLQDANYADFSYVYDHVKQRKIPALALNLDEQPTLANAIERQQQQALLLDTHILELGDLFARLDIEQLGPVYVQPLVHNKSLIAVLLIATPYSVRILTTAEEELFRSMAIVAAGLLAFSYAANEARLLAEEGAIEAIVRGLPPGSLGKSEILAARQESQAALQYSRQQIAELTQQIIQLKQQLEKEHSRITADLSDTEAGLSASQQMVAVTIERQRLRDERDYLAAQLKESQAALAGAIAPDDASLTKNMIDLLRQEKEELHYERQRLLDELERLRGQQNPVPENMPGMIDQMWQEKADLEEECVQLKARLLDIQDQLKVHGIEEGPSGIGDLIGQLYEQRSSLRLENAALKADLDRITGDKSRPDEVQGQPGQEEDRLLRIRALETEVRNLAEDREALSKQRDKLRADRDEYGKKLEVIKEHRARLLAQVAAFEMELNEMQQSHHTLREALQSLGDERIALLSERDRLAAELRAVESDREQYLARLEGDRDRIEAVSASGVGALAQTIESLTIQRARLERELHQTQARLADVETELNTLRQNAQQPQAVEIHYRPENPDLLLGLVQELRNPMTSINGYVEILLNESAGILGEAQRRSLQRVSANVKRLEAMLEDLIKITELDTGNFSFLPGAVNVISLIEDAITNASIQLREKGLVLNLNLETATPLIYGDREAISQVIGQLLTNAYLVSPPNGEIAIRAQGRQMALPQAQGPEVLTDCVFVSVTDRGGGIPPEDEPRVFSRKYKAENPLIQGLGDTGVGLAIAKALVEAHGGKLWLETRENIGSTFSFVLPVEFRFRQQENHISETPERGEG